METKIVYQCDYDGVFIGETIADESPLEPGVFLIPARSVEKKPPKLKANQAAVWDQSKSKWTTQPDWRGYRYWLPDRTFHTITELGVEPPEDAMDSDPGPSYQDQIFELTVQVQRMMDDEVKKRGYDSILSACTYATSKVPKFQAEGQACVEWRDDVWVAFYQHLGKVKDAGTDPPTFDDLVTILPAMVWPK